MLKIGSSLPRQKFFVGRLPQGRLQKCKKAILTLIAAGQARQTDFLKVPSLPGDPRYFECGEWLYCKLHEDLMLPLQVKAVRAASL